MDDVKAYMARQAQVYSQSTYHIHMAEIDAKEK